MKILFLTFSDTHSKGGLFYSTHDRIKFSSHLVDDFKIINIKFYDNWFLKIVRSFFGKSVKYKTEDSFIHDKFMYKNFWIKRKLFNSTTSWGKFEKFRKFKILCNENNINEKLISKLHDEAVNFDIIMAHYGFPNGRIAMKLSKVTNLPFCITFHGSDINIHPFINNIFYSQTREVLVNSSMNFFVSSNLCNKAISTFNIKNFCVSPNGISNNHILNSKPFKRKTISICFIGSLNHVKRADKLADIINKVNLSSNKKLKFLIIGEGEFRESINFSLSSKNIDFEMIGAISREKVIEHLANMDYLLLPSRNEGLPLVILEAIVNKVIPIASNVGGISEILDHNFTVNESDDFVNQFSNKVVALIDDPKLPELNLKKFLWSEIMMSEIINLKNIHRESVKV